MLIIAAFALGAGVCMLIAPTRRLIGPGLLLGAVAASTWGLAALASDWLAAGGGYYLGFWVLVAAHLSLLVAACLAGLALVRAGEVGLVRRPPQDRLSWLMALLGVASALAMLFFAQRRGWLSLEFGWNKAPYVWAIVLAFAVPVCAAVAVPRRFGAFLLMGWVGGGAALYVYYGYGLFSGNAWILTFGLTLLALLVVALFASGGHSRGHSTRHN